MAFTNKKFSKEDKDAIVKQIVESNKVVTITEDGKLKIGNTVYGIKAVTVMCKDGVEEPAALLIPESSESSTNA